MIGDLADDVDGDTGGAPDAVVVVSAISEELLDEGEQGSRGVEHRPSSIIQRAATVEEVANLVVYASSPQASATTGAALRVAGGVVETIA